MGAQRRLQFIIAGFLIRFDSPYPGAFQPLFWHPFRLR